MPPKLSRRRQREQEELEALKASQIQGASSDEDDLTPSVSRYTKVASFSQFMAAEEESEPESEPAGDVATKAGSKSSKSKKRKKKTSVPATYPHNADHPESSKNSQATGSTGPKHSSSGATATPSTKSEKKALKKAKAKEKKVGMDDLDQVLAEMVIKYPEAHKTSMSSADSQSLAKLLSVSLAYLDSEAELRKFFGSKVVQATKASSSSGGRRQGTSAVLRSNLTKPKPTWWAARQREGLSIRAYTDEEVQEKLDRHQWDVVGEEKWWTVEYSKKYKSMTKAFMSTVMSGDPQGFWNLLGKLPWHADTLLQVAEVHRHREEWAQAVDFVDRALFTYERSFIGAFNFTSGQNRMDFDRVENRPFFLAVHRQITDLQRRGCVRTAFEFARLLYSLDPWSDPHGALFHLDLLALKAPGMHQWLLEVYDVFLSRRRNRPQEKRDMRMDPSVLPGWTYSRALALWMMEDAKKDKDHKASSKALEEAIMSFPSVVPLLADKIDATIPNTVRTNKDFKIEVDGINLSLANSMLHMLSHLYAQHAFGVWKEPAHCAWFTSVVSSLSATLPPSLPMTPQRSDFLRLYEQNANLQYSAYRHIIVLESSYHRLFSFMPRQVTESRSFACDPSPPPSAVTTYDAEFFEGVDDAFAVFGTGTRRQREANRRRLAQLVQDDVVLRQIQDVFDGNPQVAARFPGGVMEFAQFVEQIPDDALDDLVLQFQMGAVQQEEGRMPGDFDDAGIDIEIGEEQGGPGGIEVYGEGVREIEQGRNDENDDEGEEDEDEDEDEEASPTLISGLRNIIGRFWGRSARSDESTSEDEAEPIDEAGVD